MSTLEPVPFEHEPEDEPTPRIATSSVIDSLKARRAKVAVEATFDVVVPGWGECLVLRLGSITGAQTQRIFERVQKGATVEAVNADYVVAAFRQVLARETPESDLEVLADADGDPYGLDERLAQTLELGPVANARGVLFALFAQANSPTTAISVAGGEWLDWARDASAEVDDSFLGE